MKKFLSLFTVLLVSFVLSQLPGGVSGIDMWYKTGSTVPLSKDYGPNAYPITRTGTVIEDLFNYNHCIRVEGAGNLNFPYSVEDMAVATIFTVYINEGNENSSLIYSDWRTGGYQGNGINEKGFYYSTNHLTKETFSLEYPEEEEEIPNALINTLNWFDFNSKKINNSIGTGGESTVYVGKANSNPSMDAFRGLIPEFIIYRKALSKEERQKVESYLAVKYGITLTYDVHYFNSKYDIIWDKQNNSVFGNRILAIGRDDASELYQKQSKSSHSLNEEIILSLGEFAKDNESNEFYLEDDNFIFIGDNDGITDVTEENESINDWELHKMKRTWLVQPYRTTSDEITTELRYNAAELTNRIQNEYEPEYWDDITIWLLVDRSANEQTVSTFDLNQCVDCTAYMYDATDGDYVIYSDLNWDEEESGFDQFTFAVGPKMIVDVNLQPMECNAEVGNIDIQITFGEPNFDFEIFDENELIIDSQLNILSRNISFTNLPLGWHTLKVTDATGYFREIAFEVSPTAGMNDNILEDQYLMIDDPFTVIYDPNVTIDASENVTATGVVTYEWFSAGISVGNSAEITISRPGTYTVVLTNENGCQVEDTTQVVAEGSSRPLEKDGSVDDLLAKETITIYPNPTQINNSFTVEINLFEEQDAQIQIYDFAGSLVHNELLKNSSKYQWSHRLLQSGSYLITVITKNKKLTKKLIVK
ncbi:T9SS type A sorting domain-containing protein [Moheibacter sediminis]|uniref:Por secretion system C-terminal sorting domain-containing protein n=1 Tax=Moheibacter sediminis TaxID=1434700 RepID=A0A1W1ZCK3_9FLAO|nr:T9SS type A sorting domain-containing protein [Moheibacter sediminis]SMC46133.1 Por secretion system C-terminal sorting domain-containing protein [Moheibacter sediminis]